MGLSTGFRPETSSVGAFNASEIAIDDAASLKEATADDPLDNDSRAASPRQQHTPHSKKSYHKLSS